MGAWCQETGEYFSQPWDQEIMMVAQMENKSSISVPFLETYVILTAVLTLGRDQKKILVYTDSVTASNIVNKRYCKKNQKLNSYIARFDLECTNRNIVLQVRQVPREENKVAHLLACGKVEGPKSNGVIKRECYSRRIQPLHLV